MVRIERKSARRISEGIRKWRRSGVGDYGKAIAYLGMKNRKEALAALDRAVQAGLFSSGNVNWDDDLASLRTDEEFAKLLARAKHYQATRAWIPRKTGSLIF